MLYYNKDYEMQKIIFDFLENHGLNKEMRKNHIIADIITRQVIENANFNKESFHLKNDKQAILFSLSAFVLSKRTMTSKEFNAKKHKFDINKNNSYFIIDDQGDFSYIKSTYNKYLDYIINSKCIDNISMIDNEDKDFIFSTYKEDEKFSINNINSKAEIEESSINRNLYIRQFNKLGLEKASRRINLVGNKRTIKNNNEEKVIDFKSAIKSKYEEHDFAVTEEDITRGKDLVTNKFHNIDAVCNDLNLYELMNKLKNTDISINEKPLIFNLFNSKNHIILMSDENSYPDVCPNDIEEENYENLLHYNSEKNCVYNKMNLAERKKYKNRVIKSSKEKNSSFNKTFRARKKLGIKNLLKKIIQKLKFLKGNNEENTSEKKDIDYLMQHINQTKKNNGWIYKDKDNTITYIPIVRRQFKSKNNDKTNEKGRD